jgi:hypothetical protein
MGRFFAAVLSTLSILCLSGLESSLLADDCNASTPDVPCFISCPNGCMAMVMEGKCYKQCSSYTKEDKKQEGVELKKIKVRKDVTVTIVLSDFPYSDLNYIFTLSKEFEIKPRNEKVRVTLEARNKTFQQVAEMIKKKVEK